MGTLFTGGIIRATCVIKEGNKEIKDFKQKTVLLEDDKAYCMHGNVCYLGVSVCMSSLLFYETFIEF